MRKVWLLAVLACTLAGCSSNNDQAAQPTPQQNGQADKATADTGNAAADTGNAAAEEETNAGAKADEEEASESAMNREKLGKGAFAFADETGKRLITIGDTEAKKDHYDLAVGSNGAVLKVKFEKKQASDAEDTSRQSMYNFDHIAGHVYSVAEGEAQPDDTYLMTTSDVWLPGAALAIDAAGHGQPVDEKVVQAVEAKKQRGVLQGGKIADIGADSALYLIQFERQEDDMLASLVLARGNELLFCDFPATYEPSSTWRVDDGGEISVDQFELMFAANTDKGLVLSVNWLGAEGITSFFIGEEGESGLKRLDIGVARYTAPL
ncbi:hypothetical protein [Paenibacillus methanolicus]|uniref:Lipoprotein n=1 Tax=Paenibacillus methanolicus TaxID=582686 RepID=A0A5S5C1J6_9BACL|nr:hypothetical protein [Paenibacillus methanolicus]TYP71833.1 hypothetical protein BCM02_109111 [Paenibacillus methanolicus]